MGFRFHQSFNKTKVDELDDDDELNDDDKYDDLFYLLYQQLQRIQEEGEARLEGFFAPSEGKILVIIVVIFVIFDIYDICDQTIWQILALWYL